MRLVLLAALASAAPLAAQAPTGTPAPPRVVASPVEAGAVDLDGRLDEPAWAGAEVATGFVQTLPDPGAPATERTEARVLYDGSALYVGMRMVDSGPVTSTLGRRDVRTASDYASVMLDSYDDDRTAFLFNVNPHGVQRDFLLYDDIFEDGSWDAVWSAATSRDADGWTAEFRIPLSQLRFAGGGGPQRWGVQFAREVFRTGERVAWAPVLPDEDGFVSRFGTLDGLRGLESPRRLELVPYVAGALSRAPGDAADPFYAENDLDPRVGLDLKYGLTSDLTLTATVNPDFGQVEADPAQVNLGGFELFFPERRPFFVEGTDAFSMTPRRTFASNRPTLLYTRRIGRAPQRTAFVPASVHGAAGEAGAVYTDAPGQTTILGAAKLSGRVGRFTVGVMDAVTAPEYGRFQAFDGAGGAVADGRALVEPATNYAVGRARGTFGRAVVGGLLTSVVRDTGDPALGASLPTTATVVGVDVEHALGGAWIASAQLAGSHVTGSAAAILRLQTAFPRLYGRPDAGHLALDPTATSISGLTGEVNVVRTAGEHWRGGVHASFTSPGFDANELGFQSRADFATVGGVLVYQDNAPGGALQRWSVTGIGRLGGTFGGDRTATTAVLQGGFQTAGFWGLDGTVLAEPRTADDRLARGGPLATSPARLEASVSAYSDTRRPFALSADVGAGRDELGGASVSAGSRLLVRASSALSFDVGPAVSFGKHPRQYVTAFDEPAAAATFGRRYVFAELDQATLALEGRVDWTFTPGLTLQVYARPFVSAGRFSRVQALDQPGALRLPVFGEDAGTVTASEGGALVVDPGDGGRPFTVARDFTTRALQGNAVLRWEWRPGSALFVVWQQERSGFDPDGSLRFGRDVGGLFADPVENVFLVKVTYWIG